MDPNILDILDYHQFLIRVYFLGNSFQKQVFYIDKEFDHPRQSYHHDYLTLLCWIPQYTILSF